MAFISFGKINKKILFSVFGGVFKFSCDFILTVNYLYNKFLNLKSKLE